MKQPIMLVTGASRGIGRALAQALAEAGSDVVLLGRDRKGAAAAVAEAVQCSVAKGGVGEPFDASTAMRAGIAKTQPHANQPPRDKLPAGQVLPGSGVGASGSHSSAALCSSVM